MAKEKMSVVCERVVVDTTNGKYFLIGKPSKVNDKGAFAFTQQQFNNLAAQAGLSPKQLIRNAGGAKLSFEAEFVRQGEEWINEKTAEAGVYTKDHWKINNYSVEISAQKQLNIEIAEAQAERMHSGLSFNSFMDSLEVVKKVPIGEDDPDPDQQA